MQQARPTTTSAFRRTPTIKSAQRAHRHEAQQDLHGRHRPSDDFNRSAVPARTRRRRARGAAGTARSAHRSRPGGSARRCCGRRRCGAHDGRCCTVRASRVGCVAGRIVSSRVYRRGHCRSSGSADRLLSISSSRASSSDADACPHQPGGLPDRVHVALDADPARIRVLHRPCPCPRGAAAAGCAGRHPGGVEALLQRVHRGKQQQQGARDLQRHRRIGRSWRRLATASRCSSTGRPPPG